jgi:hypothetical protein
MFKCIYKSQHPSDEIDMDKAIINLISKELGPAAISIRSKILSFTHAMALLSKIREITRE